MRSLLKRVGIATGVLVFLLVLLSAYSTAHGYTQWWLPAAASVRVNGVTSGYLHRNWSGTSVIITRTDLQPRRAYLFSLTGRKSFFDCGRVYPLRFKPFAIGDVNPPCSIFNDDSTPTDQDPPEEATMSIQPHHLEFITQHGKKVTADW